MNQICVLSLLTIILTFASVALAGGYGYKHQPKQDYSYNHQYEYNYDYNYNYDYGYDYSSYPKCTYAPKGVYSHYDGKYYYYNTARCYVIVVDSHYTPAPTYPKHTYPKLLLQALNQTSQNFIKKAMLDFLFGN